MASEITRIESVESSDRFEGLGMDQRGVSLAYASGESIGGNSPGAAQVDIVADYLVEKTPLERKRHWYDIERALYTYDHMGSGPIYISPCDFAGSDTNKAMKRTNHDVGLRQ